MGNIKKLLTFTLLLSVFILFCFPETDSSEKIIPDEKENVEIPAGKIYPEPKRKRLSISGANHKFSKKFREYYLTPYGMQSLAKSLGDSELYRPYIRKKLRENKMPLILQYLPIVESNYKTTAVSRAGATGIWQFMTNSMDPFLKKNEWYDERRDPWKSTDAAVAKLKDNYKMFNDWALALAAYNCGAGAMRKILAEHPGKDFWYLAEHGYIREESAQYVPKFLAIADIIENAEYYGAIDIGAADKAIEGAKVKTYDYVNVTKMLTLKKISKITGITEEDLSILNPALLHECTPPDETYQLRVPKGKGKTAQKKLAKYGIPEKSITVTVKPGDSLWSLSKEYGVSVEEIRRFNKMSENDILTSGKAIIIPINKEEK